MPAAIADRGQVVRRVEPARQPLRQEQQQRAGDAAEEVRGLDDAERQQAIEQREACAAAGVAPENSSTTPATKVNMASTRGVSCSASARDRAGQARGVMTAAALISAPARTMSAIDSGSR